MSDYFNLFITNLYKFISDLNRYIPDPQLDLFIESFNNIDFNMIIVRYLKKIRPFQNSLKTNDESIFEKSLFIFPEIDISNFWPKLNKGQKGKIFAYLQVLYIQAELILENDNKENINFLNNIKTNEFNPFIGLGEENAFNIECMKEGIDNLVETDVGAPGIESMLGTLGIDKMLDVDSILKNLNQMSDEEIENTTSTFQKMFHGNKKVETFMEDIISNFRQELKENIKPEKNNFADVMKMAQNVSEKIKPDIKKEDIDVGQLINNLKNMTPNDNSPLSNQLHNLANIMGKFAKNPSAANMNKMMANMPNGMIPNGVIPNKAQANNPHAKKYVPKNKK